MAEPDRTSNDAGTSPDDASRASPSGTPGSRRRPWSPMAHTPEEIEAAKQQWRDMRPWDSPMARGDKVLISSTVAVIALMLLTLPVRPFLLATHPVALSAVTGSLSAVGAAAAFARVGGTDVWLVLVAGVFGTIKFDWLFWWAGRRWGAKGVRFFTPPGRAQRFVERVRSWPPWSTGLLVVAAALPGVPSVPLFLLAGLAGMCAWRPSWSSTRSARRSSWGSSPAWATGWVRRPSSRADDRPVRAVGQRRAHRDRLGSRGAAAAAEHRVLTARATTVLGRPGEEEHADRATLLTLEEGPHTRRRPGHHEGDRGAGPCFCVSCPPRPTCPPSRPRGCPAPGWAWARPGT